jgi:hypothetical protein
VRKGSVCRKGALCLFPFLLERRMDGEQLGSPAAAILARRASRAAMPERLQEQAPDDSSDDEWDPRKRTRSFT